MLNLIRITRRAPASGCSQPLSSKLVDDAQGAGSAIPSEAEVQAGATATLKVELGTSDTARKRILLVEDNADSAELVSALLEMEGHEVVIAPDGPAALQVAVEYNPDVVLLDIGLPGMDGYEVGRRLRQEPRLAGKILVALPGYGREEDLRRSRETGFDDHLVKPVDMDLLRRVVNLRK